jgi:hypothetical protein
MLYSGLVIDNTKYFELGTIRVRIFAYYNAPRFVNGTEIIRDDLSEDFASIEAAVVDSDKNIHEEFEALVFAPFGGGRNYGAFHLPQMNERGVVSFLDGDFGKPIWLGSYFSAIKRDDAYKPTTINIPNEDPAMEGEDSDGVIENGVLNNKGIDEKLRGTKDTLVIRTKTIAGGDEAGMDWQQTSTENLIVLDDKKVRVRHSSQWNEQKEEKYQEVLIYKDENNTDKDTVQLEVNNVKDEKRGVLKLTENGFKIEMYSGSDVSTFELFGPDDDYTINFSDKHGNIIKGDADGLHLTTDDSAIVDINGTNDTIVLYSNLKDVLEKLAEHIHIGSVPTTPPLDSSLAPISPQLTKPIIDMEGNMVKSRHK